MKLATILAWSGLATSIYCLSPSHVSIERNVTPAKHLGSFVDHLKLIVEPVDSKLLPAPNLAQRTSENFDINDIATPEEWQRYVGKGSFLGYLLDMSDEKAGVAWPDPLGRTPKSVSSQWVGTLESEMRTWGWQQGQFVQKGCEWVTGEYSGREIIVPALTALGLSFTSKAHGGDNVCYNLEHGDYNAKDDDGDRLDFEEQHYVVDGKTYSCTGANYVFAINHVGGAILTMLLANPLHSAETNWIEEPKDALLPQLRRASDLIFAYWLRNNPDPKNLKYYIANNVQNAQTLPAIASILKNKGLTAAPEWPGVTLSAWEGNEVEALLGSPIGATLGHMLVQHKRELGRKHVAQVFLFRDQKKTTGKDDPALQLVYKIRNVPDPQPEKKPGEKQGQEKPDAQGHGAIRVSQVVRREEGERMLGVHEFRLRRDGKVQVS